jgi:hypothetical protein
MPKEGWIEVKQDMCPMCGQELRVPAWESIKWTVEEPYSLFTGAGNLSDNTGAMAIPVCCKVWATWRNTDKVWRYEIRDHYHWKFKGGIDGKQLNERIKEVSRESGTGDLLPVGWRGPDLLPTSVGLEVHEVGNGKDKILGTSGKVSQQHAPGRSYDF